MIRNLMALPCMMALVLACGQGRTDGQDTGASGGAGMESGALPADTGYTGSGIEDTTGGIADSANQDQSGVNNTETGQSELGEDITKTTPDQGEPVTAKGDTVGVAGEGATNDTTY